MPDFKKRFAEYNPATDDYEFSDVRNGLIVGLVCDHCPHYICRPN